MTNKQRHIGQAIKFVRLSQDLSQEELAKAAGVSGSFISLVEVGQREPSWDVIQKLCAALKVDVTLLAMLLESDTPFVQPIISLAYHEIAKVSHGRNA